MSVCRGCGKQIIWMRTAEGKAMPCDPEVHKVYAGGKKESFLSLNGHMVRGNTEGGDYIADGRHVRRLNSSNGRDKEKKQMKDNVKVLSVKYTGRSAEVELENERQEIERISSPHLPHEDFVNALRALDPIFAVHM